MYIDKMELTLETLVQIIDKLEYKIGQASLLTYPDFVILKGIETVIDIQHMRYSLKWNVHAATFYPKSHSQSKASNASEQQETHNKDRRSKNQHNKNITVLDRQ